MHVVKLHVAFQVLVAWDIRRYCTPRQGIPISCWYNKVISSSVSGLISAHIYLQLVVLGERPFQNTPGNHLPSSHSEATSTVRHRWFAFVNWSRDSNQTPSLCPWDRGVVLSLPSSHRVLLLPSVIQRLSKTRVSLSSATKTWSSLGEHDYSLREHDNCRSSFTSLPKSKWK